MLKPKSNTLSQILQSRVSGGHHGGMARDVFITFDISRFKPRKVLVLNMLVKMKV